MRSCSLVSLRPFGLIVLAVMAAGPAVLVACQQPGNDTPNPAPAATVVPPVVTVATPTATVSAAPLAPLAPLGGATPANPGTPGTPGHPHPTHVDGGGGGPAGTATAANGGIPGLPFPLPSGLPPIPSNLAIPSAFALPSNLPQLVPPASSAQ